MLVAFALRALIPQGFMLGGDRGFSIEICWDGFPAALLAQVGSGHADSMGMDSMDMGAMDMGAMDMGAMAKGPLQGGHHHSPTDHCVFGSACTAGPILHLALPTEFSTAHLSPAVGFDSIADAILLVHLPPSRAPPAQLS
jgi:hypothetical protein